MIVATSRGLFSIDCILAEIEHLARLATVVLNGHLSDNGLCAVCVGVAFPCASVVVAEHNVALAGSAAGRPFVSPP